MNNVAGGARDVPGLVRAAPPVEPHAPLVTFQTGPLNDFGWLSGELRDQLLVAALRMICACAVTSYASYLVSGFV